jgi:hypothetical protein
MAPDAAAMVRRLLAASKIRSTVEEQRSALQALYQSVQGPLRERGSPQALVAHCDALAEQLLGAGGLDAVAELLRHRSDGVHSDCLALLGNLAPSTRFSEAVASHRFIVDTLVRDLGNLAPSAYNREVAATSLGALALHSVKFCRAAAEAGAAKALVELLGEATRPAAQGFAIQALGNLTRDSANRAKAAAEAGALAALARLVARPAAAPNFEQAAQAVTSLLEQLPPPSQEKHAPQALRVVGALLQQVCSGASTAVRQAAVQVLPMFTEPGGLPAASFAQAVVQQHAVVPLLQLARQRSAAAPVRGSAFIVLMAVMSQPALRQQHSELIVREGGLEAAVEVISSAGSGGVAGPAAANLLRQLVWHSREYGERATAAGAIAPLVAVAGLHPKTLTASDVAACINQMLSHTNMAQRADEVVDAGALPHLVRALQDRSDPPAQRAAAQVVSKLAQLLLLDDSSRRAQLEQGMRPAVAPLARLTGSSRSTPELAKSAAVALNNLVGASRALADAAVEAGAADMVARCVMRPDAQAAAPVGQAALSALEQQVPGVSAADSLARAARHAAAAGGGGGGGGSSAAAAAAPGGGTPGATAPPSSEACAACGAGRSSDGKALRHCSACSTVAYCSRECQQSHWGKHKPSCRAGRRNSLKQNTVFKVI